MMPLLIQKKRGRGLTKQESCASGRKSGQRQLIIQFCASILGLINIIRILNCLEGLLRVQQPKKNIIVTKVNYVLRKQTYLTTFKITRCITLFISRSILIIES